MGFFQVPPRTQYDLQFTLFGIPIRIHPLFWLMALLLGGLSGDVATLLIWVVAVFISILIHELGHSMAMRLYGQNSFIVLHMFGGLAVPDSSSRGGRWGNVSLSSNQHILISFAGPLAGFLFAAVIIGVVAVLGGVVYLDHLFRVIPLPGAFLLNVPDVVNTAIFTFLWVNVFWGLINLMPVFPLDGGNISRHLFIKADPWDGVRKSLWLSVIAGAIVAVAGFALLKSTYMALLFGILALQSYQMLQGRSGGLF